MVDDLVTFSGVEAVLAATADYDVTRDASKARRRVAALRRKLDFAASSGRDGQTIQYQQQVIERQLQQALAWLRAYDTPTDAQRLKNPQVTHADFSTFGGYSAYSDDRRAGS